jgi:very-short-patch-repair endonuclease
VPDEYGVPIYRIDLGYEEHRVGVEYDGASHADGVTLSHDRARHNWLADHGWRMRYFTARDLYRNPTAVVASVRALLTPP